MCWWCVWFRFGFTQGNRELQLWPEFDWADLNNATVKTLSIRQLPLSTLSENWASHCLLTTESVFVCFFSISLREVGAQTITKCAAKVLANSANVSERRSHFELLNYN